MSKELFPQIGANLTSASHVIDALGGTGKVAAIFGLDDRVVSNWRTRGLPPGGRRRRVEDEVEAAVLAEARA